MHPDVAPCPCAIARREFRRQVDIPSFFLLRISEARRSGTRQRQHPACALLKRPIGMLPFTGSRRGSRELACDRFECPDPGPREC